MAIYSAPLVAEFVHSRSEATDRSTKELTKRRERKDA